ncbi:MAG: SGNH/GDSL hydrolase family protein [Deltaproteobacteria bacterium]
MAERDAAKGNKQLMRLLVRGGSLSAGFGVSKSYVDIITEYLFPKGIEVINRSRYRETTFDGIGTFSEDVDFFKPDILFFHFGIDDAFQCIYRSEFQENMVQMIRLARSRFNPVVILATSHSFDDPYDMDAIYIFYRSLRIVAEDMDCEMMPVHYYWAGYLEEHGLKSADLTLSDTRYPNERGHQVIADAAMKGLEKIIQKKEIG